jgi:hypothetical protein
VSFDLGDTVRLSAECRDAADSLTDATTVVLTITLPDGSTATPVVVNPPGQTGQYRADYVAEQPGRHAVRWAFSTPSAAYTDVFNVRVPAAPMLFSLRDAKKQLDIPLTSTGDDEELRDYIESVTGGVEYYVGPIVRRTVQQVVSGGGQSWVLHTTPVLAVTAVTALQAFQATIGVGVLDVDAETGIVRRTDGIRLYSGDYRLTYTAGRTIGPPSAILAGKLVLQHLWRTRYGAARGPTSADDFLTTEPVPGFGYAIPNRALQLLEPSQVPPGVA